MKNSERLLRFWKESKSNLANMNNIAHANSVHNNLAHADSVHNNLAHLDTGIVWRSQNSEPSHFIRREMKKRR